MAVKSDGKTLTGLFRGWEEKGTKVFLLLETSPGITDRLDSTKITEAYLGIPEPQWKGKKHENSEDG